VSLTSENLDTIGGFSYICPKCSNIVAIKFKNYTLQPRTVMKLEWNREIRNRAMRIKNNLFFSLCENKKRLSCSENNAVNGKKRRYWFSLY